MSGVTLRERIAMAACGDTEKNWRESSEDWHEHWLAAADRILALCNESGLRALLSESWELLLDIGTNPHEPQLWTRRFDVLREKLAAIGIRHAVSDAALQSPPAPESSELTAFENRLVNTMRFAALVKDMRMLAIRVLGMGDRQPGYEAWQDAVRKEVQGFAQEMLERLDAIIAADGHIPPAPAQESGWISVKERLPDCDSPKNPDQGWMIFSSNGIEITNIHPAWWDRDFRSVTHWMPLPPPPKGAPDEEG